MELPTRSGIKDKAKGQRNKSDYYYWWLAATIRKIESKFERKLIICIYSI